MTAPRILPLTLLLAAAALAADGTTLPLKPVVRTGPSDVGREYRLVRPDKDGLGEIPFATASGKLRLKLSGQKVLADRNDDGKFDDADGDGAGKGETLKVPIKLAGKAFDYPFSVQFMQLGSRNLAQPQAVYLIGMVHLEAQMGQTVVRLYDTNLNGRFGDISVPDKEPGDLLQVGAAPRGQPITRYVALDGKIQEFSVVNDGQAVKLQPYTGPTANVKVDAKEGWKVTAALRSSDGGFVGNCEGGAQAALLPGAYRLEQAKAESGPRKDEGGRSRAAIEFYAWGAKDASLQIKEGDSTLAFGPPFKLDFAAVRSTEDEADVNVTEVALIGAGGERYRADNYGSGGDSTMECAVRAAGRDTKVATLAYG